MRLVRSVGCAGRFGDGLGGSGLRGLGSGRGALFVFVFGYRGSRDWIGSGAGASEGEVEVV